MNNELSKRIQERIDANNITPIPRWRFILISAVFWLMATLSVIIGSFAVGGIQFLFLDYNHHNLISIPYSLTEFLLMIPYLWIIIFLLFIAIAKIGIAHTKKGYQYKIHTVIVASVLLSVIFGSILNYIGVSKIAHESLDEIQIYNYVTYDSEDAYTKPAIGRLAGNIIDVKDKNNFSLKDFSGHIWNIRLGSTIDRFTPELNTTVQMFGLLESSSSVFIAKSIRKWNH
jgi:hypothetical protein